jgi:hypothetical protein
VQNHEKEIVMTSNGNQPKQPDQSNKPQQSDSSRTPNQDKGRPQNEGGTNRGNTDDQRGQKGSTGSDRSKPADQQGDRSRKDSTGNKPDVTIPNPKNPGYGDNEPGDPRHLEIDAEKPSQSSGKKDTRRS